MSEGEEMFLMLSEQYREALAELSQAREEAEQYKAALAEQSRGRREAAAAEEEHLLQLHFEDDVEVLVESSARLLGYLHVFSAEELRQELEEMQRDNERLQGEKTELQELYEATSEQLDTVLAMRDEEEDSWVQKTVGLEQTIVKLSHELEEARSNEAATAILPDEVEEVRPNEPASEEVLSVEEEPQYLVVVDNADLEEEIERLKEEHMEEKLALKSRIIELENERAELQEKNAAMFLKSRQAKLLALNPSITSPNRKEASGAVNIKIKTPKELRADNRRMRKDLKAAVQLNIETLTKLRDVLKQRIEEVDEAQEHHKVQRSMFDQKLQKGKGRVQQLESKLSALQIENERLRMRLSAALDSAEYGAAMQRIRKKREDDDPS